MTGQWFAAAAAADANTLGSLVRIDMGVIDTRDDQGRNALHILSTLPGDAPIQAAKVLISAGTSVDVADEDGRTPLWHAIGASNRPMALFLLDAGASTDGCLHHALSLRDLDIVRELVDCGADLEETQGGETPAEAARRLGFAEAAALIEEETQRRS
ncbi:MAG: ankyrin repeat domain-containing protein [Bryobacterales bacterium]|nr:ankyrin repeat domain-containing protein [Bryobacterales bacterium]